MNDHDKFKCPHCGSDNTVSIPLVYKRGHATGTATHTGVVGYDVKTTTTTYADGRSETKETGRSPIYGNVTRDTYTITDLAKEIEPPKTPEKPLPEESGCLINTISYILSSSISFLGSFVLVGTFFKEKGFIFLPIIFIVSTFLLFSIFSSIGRKISGKNKHYKIALENYERALARYHIAYRKWEKGYICMRCGHRFYVE